jgi:hypothetical protein
MTDARLFAINFTGPELLKIHEDCKTRILDGRGQVAFVTQSSAGGRSAALLKDYSSIELQHIIYDAIQIQLGKQSGRSVTYPRFLNEHSIAYPTA